MTHPVDNRRRNLLRGLPAMTASPVRPPGAIFEPEFTNGCTACDLCANACPESIIISGSGGFPEIDFRRGECTFCAACIDACPEPVLRSDIQPPWQLRLGVRDRCLAQRQVICQSCADICNQQAISFPPRLEKVATPQIDSENCNGCGACISACPENALVLETAQTVTLTAGVALHG